MTDIVSSRYFFCFPQICFIPVFSFSIFCFSLCEDATPASFETPVARSESPSSTHGIKSLERGKYLFFIWRRVKRWRTSLRFICVFSWTHRTLSINLFFFFCNLPKLFHILYIIFVIDIFCSRTVTNGLKKINVINVINASLFLWMLYL